METLNKIGEHMPLIEAGKYEVSFNQEYLLQKLSKLDTYSALFWGFWVSVFLAFIAYWVWDLLWLGKRMRAARLKESEENDKERILHDIFKEFHELCRLIHEDLNVFRRPEAMIQTMYYGRLQDLITQMSLEHKFMQKNYRHLIPDYEHYRRKLSGSK
jgi:hypothetical protein